ncbi:hypothetical protein [Siccibacter colletis]|uniref:hypothetical protein n=1 Tax=Siccibacter colletis TaxID=1505757 RepID=UPI003CF283C7
MFTRTAKIIASILFVLAIVASWQAHAEAYSPAESKVIAGHGEKAVTLAQCLAWGRYAGKDADVLKPLADGFLNESRAFIEAVQTKELDKKVANNSVPIIWMMILNDWNPTTDFAIGKLWQTLDQSAYDKLQEPVKDIPYTERKELIKNGATQSFDDANCKYFVGS